MNKNKNLEIAQEIINILEKVNPEDWHKSWNCAKGGSFRNAKTGSLYNGINFLRLYAETIKNGYQDHRWLTFNQVKELGGSVKSGSKSVELMFFTDWDKKEKCYFDKNKLIDKGYTLEQINQYIEDNVYVCIKNFRVFNVEQCKDLKVELAPELSQEQMQAKTSIIANEIINNSQAKVYHDGIDKAYYQPSNDTIHLPEVKTFDSMDDYYATALHEISHSTGHESRLNRKLAGNFGSSNYAKEELVAEFAAVMLQNTAGIELKGEHIENHAAYIKSWLNNTKTEDKAKELLQAINQADKASKYVCEHYLSKELLKEASRIQIEGIDIIPLNFKTNLGFLLDSPDSAGWISEHKNTKGKYYYQNSNDLGNIDYRDLEEQDITIIGKHAIGKGMNIYLTAPEDFNLDEAVSFKEAVNEIKSCWTKTIENKQELPKLAPEHEVKESDKDVYLFFDHEWNYAHCELIDKKYFNDCVKSEASLKQTYDFYSKENVDGRHTWFLGELLNDHKVMEDKVSLILRENGATMTEWANVVNVTNRRENFVNDDCGNYMVKLQMPETLAKEFKRDVKMLNLMDWDLHRKSELGTSLPNLCKENEIKYCEFKGLLRKQEQELGQKKDKGLEMGM